MQWMWSLVEWPIYSLPGLNNIYIHPQHFLFSLWSLDFSRLLSIFFILIFWILMQKGREDAFANKLWNHASPYIGIQQGQMVNSIFSIWRYYWLREISRGQDPKYRSDTETRALSARCNITLQLMHWQVSIMFLGHRMIWRSGITFNSLTSQLILIFHLFWRNVWKALSVCWQGLLYPAHIRAYGQTLWPKYKQITFRMCSQTNGIFLHTILTYSESLN